MHNINQYRYAIRVTRIHICGFEWRNGLRIEQNIHIHVLGPRGSAPIVEYRHIHAIRTKLSFPAFDPEKPCAGPYSVPRGEITFIASVQSSVQPQITWLLYIARYCR